MKTFFTYTAFTISIVLIPFVPARAQSIDTGHYLTLNLAFDGSVTTFAEPHDDRSNQLTSFSGLSAGISYVFPSGINPIIQVSGQQLRQPIEGMVSDSQVWYFMGGIYLKNRDYPFYMNLLLGLNRHMYDFGSELDMVFEPVNNFASEVEFGYESFIISSVPIRISVGTRDPFNTGVGLDNLFFKIGTSFSIGLF